MILFLKNLLILCLVVLDLCCCTDFSLVIVSGGSSLVVVFYLLSLWSMGSIAVAHGPSCSSDRWDLPGPGIELMSPALAGRVLTTEPQGKPWWFFLKAVLEETLLCGYFQCSDSRVTASALPFLSTVVDRHLLIVWQGETTFCVNKLMWGAEWNVDLNKYLFKEKKGPGIYHLRKENSNCNNRWLHAWPWVLVPSPFHDLFRFILITALWITQ